MERKKTGLLVIGVFVLVLSIIGVTYAFWQLRLFQNSEDTIASSCFDIELVSEQDAIQLEKAFPIPDSEGEELTPYKFTLRNNCQANVKYQINLESLDKIGGITSISEENQLNAQYLKVKLNEENKEGSIHLLNENEVDPTLENAYESHKLTTGYLGLGKSKTYELRLWLNEDSNTNYEEIMNKTFASKINITATYSKNNYDTLVDTILAIETETEGSGETGLYEVTHDDASITYTNEQFYIDRLKQPELRYAGSDPDNYVNVGEFAAEDRYELRLCIGDVCNNLGASPSFEVAEYYTILTSCEAKKEDEGLKSILESTFSDIPYDLNCVKIANKGDNINLWRIVGLVNTPEGQRVKIIRDDDIGRGYSLDTSASTINGGMGINEWSQSDLMKLLNPGYEKNELENENGEKQLNQYVNNSLFWNGSAGQCYIEEKNATIDCDFSNTKIPETLKNMIENVTWNTGTVAKNDNKSINTKDSYVAERSNNIGNTCKEEGGGVCNDNVLRTTSWKGKVGLIYPSDYGYATSGGDTNNRNECLNLPVTDWRSAYQEDHPNCYGNDWLLYTKSTYWTITPFEHSQASSFGFAIDHVGNLLSNTLGKPESIRPVVYLKPDVFVSSGDGSKDTPYVLSID